MKSLFWILIWKIHTFIIKFLSKIRTLSLILTTTNKVLHIMYTIWLHHTRKTTQWAATSGISLFDIGDCWHNDQHQMYICGWCPLEHFVFWNKNVLWWIFLGKILHFLRFFFNLTKIIKNQSFFGQNLLIWAAFFSYKLSQIIFKISS